MDSVSAGDGADMKNVSRGTFYLESVRSRVPTRLLEAWEERSAIMEFDGKMMRDDAEKAALEDVLRHERAVQEHRK